MVCVLQMKLSKLSGAILISLDIYSLLCYNIKDESYVEMKLLEMKVVIIDGDLR